MVNKVLEPRTLAEVEWGAAGEWQWLWGNLIAYYSGVDVSGYS